MQGELVLENATAYLSHILCPRNGNLSREIDGNQSKVGANYSDTGVIHLHR